MPSDQVPFYSRWENRLSDPPPRAHNGYQGRLPKGWLFPQWVACLPCQQFHLSASAVFLDLEIILFTLDSWHENINFRCGQRKGELWWGLGMCAWNRLLFLKQILLVCPRLKCTWIAERTFFQVSTEIFVDWTMEDIFRSREHSLKSSLLFTWWNIWCHSVIFGCRTSMLVCLVTPISILMARVHLIIYALLIPVS